VPRGGRGSNEDAPPRDLRHHAPTDPRRRIPAIDLEGHGTVAHRGQLGPGVRPEDDDPALEAVVHRQDLYPVLDAERDPADLVRSEEDQTLILGEDPDGLIDAQA